MSTTQATSNTTRSGIFKEIAIQIGIAFIFFLGTSFGRGNDVGIQWHRLVFIGNYLVAALIINYFLLPRFYYRRSYLKFAFGVLLAILFAVFLEEFVLEQILFPDTRGARFMGSIFMMIRMMPFIMLFVGFKFAWDAQSRQRELEKLQTLVSQSQLQFLKSQVNPHFLFNSLNNLYSYALDNSPKTPQIILELSSLLRYMLYDCRSERVPLKDEVKYLNDFIKLQSLQIEDRGQIEFTTDGSFENHFVAPLILIVFIENCFKHSTASQSDQIVINVHLELNDNILSLYCKNTFTQQKNTTSLTAGIGLENVKKRLDLLYPEAYDLNISSDENWYHVDLKITLDS